MYFEDLDYTELDFVRRELVVIAGERGVSMVRRVARDTEPHAFRIVGRYAPLLPNQRYIRTETYKRSVFSEVEDITDGSRLTFGSTGAIQDGRRYDPFIKDRRQQASIHRGRWATLQDDATEAMEKVDGRLMDGLHRLGFK
jgi:hypothetical protein